MTREECSALGAGVWTAVDAWAQGLKVDAAAFSDRARLLSAVLLVPVTVVELVQDARRMSRGSTAGVSAWRVVSFSRGVIDVAPWPPSRRASVTVESNELILAGCVVLAVEHLEWRGREVPDALAAAAAMALMVGLRVEVGP